MIRKDKVLLESLIKKYNKNAIIKAINEDINNRRSSQIRQEMLQKRNELLSELKFELIDLLKEYYNLSGMSKVSVDYTTANGTHICQIRTDIEEVDYEEARIIRSYTGEKPEPITEEEYEIYINSVEEMIEKYKGDELKLVSGHAVKRLVEIYKDYRVFICRGFQYRGARYAEDDKETKNTPVPGGYKVMTFEERINRLCEYYAAFDIRIDRENKTLYINAFSSNDLY
jgi:hypothetical protein